MIDWLESLPTIASGTLIVACFVALALLFGWVVGKVSPRDVRIEHNDLAGFILAVIGVIYAVLLAFVVIGAWERFQQAESRTYEEASALTTIYRDADSFPNGGHELRAAVRTYVETIVNDEWPKMARGEESTTGDAQIERVDKLVRALPVSSQSVQGTHGQMLAAMNVALSDRDARLSEDATGINSIMWVVLMVGAAVTIGFTCLFGFRRDSMQYIMVGSLALLIGLVLFLAIALNYPYRGSITVDPKAYHTALHNFNVLGP